MVDDSDSSIQYSGSGWFSYSGSMSEVGNFGPTYQNTLHGTNSSGSLSLSFHGEFYSPVPLTVTFRSNKTLFRHYC